MVEAGEITADKLIGVLRGDARRLPFPDATFDVVITSEVLEHIQDDVAAIAEMVRVLEPGGRFAATVPAWFPEVVNWKLSDEYHAPKSAGGHVRIYSRTELRSKLRSAGLDVDGYHRAHALHSPYWWLKCAVGPAQRRSSCGHPVPPVPRVGHHRAAPQHRVSPSGCCHRCSARARCTTPPNHEPPVLPRHPAARRPNRADREQRPRGPRRADGARDHRVGRAPRLAADGERHDPVVRGRPQRSVEPRRVGDGARRRRLPRRGRARLRMAGRHPAPRRLLAQLLPS